MTGITLLPLLFVFSGFFINLIIALIIYNDAKKYTDSPILWFFIVFFLPLFLGVILYLLLRTDFISGNSTCPSCDNTIESSFTFCPHCHYKLKKTCDNCHAFVEDDYNICPHCGHDLKKPCDTCGKKLEKDYLICPYCGTKQEEKYAKNE